MSNLFTERVLNMAAVTPQPEDYTGERIMGDAYVDAGRYEEAARTYKTAARWRLRRILYFLG